MKTLCTAILSLTILLGLAQSARAEGKEQYAILLKLTPRLLDGGEWTKADNEAVEAHFMRLKALTEQGKVILAGRTLTEDASGFGIIILEVAGEAEAREVMVGDPAVKAGVMTAQLFPYRVALMRAAEPEGK
jgi:uncharacterized protein YciI